MAIVWAIAPGNEPLRGSESLDANPPGPRGPGVVRLEHHREPQPAATRSPFTSSTASPSITSSLALASDSGLM